MEGVQRLDEAGVVEEVRRLDGGSKTVRWRK